MSNLSSPIIILFLGGFTLASAANKYKIDRVLAKKLLSPFGTKTENGNARNDAGNRWLLNVHE